MVCNNDSAYNMDVSPVPTPFASSFCADSRHLQLPHSFTVGLKPTSVTNPPHRRLPSSARTDPSPYWLLFRRFLLSYIGFLFFSSFSFLFRIWQIKPESMTSPVYGLPSHVALRPECHGTSVSLAHQASCHQFCSGLVTKSCCTFWSLSMVPEGLQPPDAAECDWRRPSTEAAGHTCASNLKVLKSVVHEKSKDQEMA